MYKKKSLITKKGLMSASDKKFLLELPLKVILTEDGASNFISHNKKLLRFRVADNLDEYGISLNEFSPQSIQNMILLDYISKIEISMSEFVSSRQEVMDLSKVIVFSLLYKQFDREVDKIAKTLKPSDCAVNIGYLNGIPSRHEIKNVSPAEAARAMKYYAIMRKHDILQKLDPEHHRMTSTTTGVRHNDEHTKCSCGFGYSADMSD
jgi:hypothetical protein